MWIYLVFAIVMGIAAPVAYGDPPAPQGMPWLSRPAPWWFFALLSMGGFAIWLRAL